MHNNSNNLTRKELTETLAEQLGFSQSNCAQIVDSFFDNIKQSMLNGESIKLVHFGTFTIRDKSPRRGRNPRTGESITIKKRQAVSFRPSKKLREQVNN
ncbi:integration host factor subunit alpha [Desulforhopalus singaporensis]|uniref:Integration host factor subunit alpha n=1 Tax=Desulforhopalus singaporensis TaxID=91360 RepID=A0A1H0NUF6_9BACT|nr:integration host factor subunit alpha [Desulforhopalus singaporensis]SDO96294.1 integration host factor subunit alpha [Desulforhopalus singaporensis]